MDTIKDKIKNLDKRISDVSNQIKNLQQTKVNLMMLKRDLGMKDVEVTLKDTFTEELKEILTQKFNTELDLDKVDRSNRE